MIRRVVLAGLLAFATLGPVRGESLVATLSDNDVQITSNFTGEQIVVFGAIRGAAETERDFEVAVVVQGPAQDLVVRRKQRVLGVWVNRASRELDAVPSFYVMHLSPNFAAAADPDKLKEYRLGLASLPFVQDAEAEGQSRAFAQAIVRLRQTRGLYVERRNEVLFLAPNVFRTNFFLPSDIPTGEYNVRVYLFRGGAFLAGNAQTLRIEKGGYSERIAQAAQTQPLLYGLACVLLAVITGWLAGVIFRRP